MKFTDYISMSLRNLRRQKTRTTLTIIAIVVGSLSLILMMSIIISIRASLIKQFQNLGAFDLVTVVKDPNSVDANNLIGGSNGDPSEGKKIDDTTLASIKNLPYVAEATPTLSVNIGTIRLKDQQKKTWANLIAFDPENDVFDLPMAAGRKLTSEDMDKIVVGDRFVQDMGYGSHAKDLIGKTVLLNYKMGGTNAPDWGALPIKPPQNADENWYKAHQNSSVDISAEIVGITASANVDNGASYINIAWGRRLMTTVYWKMQDNSKQGNNGYQIYQPPTMVLQKDDQFVNNGYSSIIIKVDDTANVTKVASEVQGLGYGANTAQNMIDNINKVMAIVGALLAAIGGISLFVAAIGITNTMIMATYERMREIGVLRACGATRATIRHLFTIEAALLGFFGGAFGITISLALGAIARLLVRQGGVNLGSIPIDQIGSFPLWLIGAVLAFATFIGVFAGLYPAIRAAKMNPVDALRYE